MNDRGSNCLLAVKILLRLLGIRGISLNPRLHNLINTDLYGIKKDEENVSPIQINIVELLKKLKIIRNKLIYKNQNIAGKTKLFRSIEKLLRNFKMETSTT